MNGWELNDSNNSSRSRLPPRERVVERLPDDGRIRRALQLSHRAAEQHAVELLLTGPEPGDLRGLRVEDLADGGEHGSGVLLLVQAQRLGARPGIPAVRHQLGEQG